MSKLPWPRILAEGALIVVSILVAFGIDSTWQAFQDARLETQYLEAFLVDVEGTLANSEERARQQRENRDRMADIALRIEAGEEVADSLVLSGPTVYILAESMDTYRDLVASGGTTRIRSLEVRRVMSQLLRRVDYNHQAEQWALGSLNAMVPAIWASPRPIPRERLQEVMTIYASYDDVLLDAHDRLTAYADTALAVIRSELGEDR